MTVTPTQTRRTRSYSSKHVPAIKYGGLVAMLFAKAADLGISLVGLEIAPLVETNFAVALLEQLGVFLSMLGVALAVVVGIVLVVELAARLVAFMTWGPERPVLLVYLAGYWIPALIWSTAAVYNGQRVVGVLA